MSRVRIGGAGGSRNVRPCRTQQRTVQSSDVPQGLIVVMVAELFVTGAREFQTAGAMMLNALDWKLILVAG